VIELDADLAIYYAKIGKNNKLALADSISYATSRFKVQSWEVEEDEWYWML